MAKPFRGVINVDGTQSVPGWEPYTQPIAPEGTPSAPNIDRIAQRAAVDVSSAPFVDLATEARVACMRD
jgi:hypothetical protein